MIPVLYKKEEEQYRNYGLGEISEIQSPVVRRERQGSYYQLYFKYPENGKFADVFEEGMKIKSDAGARTKWQTFEISRILRKTNQPIEIFAKHISQSLKKDVLEPEVSVRDSTADNALWVWNNNRVGDESFDVWSNISLSSSTSWSIHNVSNAFEALVGVRGSILDVWGGEYEFDNKTIRLHREMGRKAPIMLEYGRNIVSVEQDQQDDNVYTSIYPYAIYHPDGEEGAEQSAEQEIITIPEHFVDGKYLEMHNYRKIQLVDFSSEFDSESIPSVDRLRSLATQFAERNEIGSPQENIRVEYIDLSKTLDYKDFEVMEEVELNDIIPIFYPNFNIINNNAKVVATEYDPSLEVYIAIELGVVGQSFRSITVGNIDSRLENLEKKVDVTVPYLINGQGNKVWYTKPNENTEHKIGDIWFEENGPYTRIRVWNGNQWIIELDTETFAREIEKAIEEQQRELDEIRGIADNASEKVDNIADDILDNVSENVLENAIEYIDIEISKIDFGEDFSTRIEEINRLAQEALETSKVSGEIIGNDGRTLYNRNRLQGSTSRTITHESGQIILRHNGEGFMKGAPYVLSMKAVELRFPERSHTTDIKTNLYIDTITEYITLGSDRK